MITLNDTLEGEDIAHAPMGLYKVYWKSGGSSVAAVGQLYSEKMVRIR